MPQRIAGVDARALPIGPVEAFVLSCVDGQTPVADIAAATSLDEPRVESILNQLIELGAVALATAPARPIPRRMDEQREPLGARLDQPVVEQVQVPVPHPASARYDPVELGEECDLSLSQKRSILDLYHGLEDLSHYEVLKVDPKSSRSVIKAAYFEFVGLYHPDKHFGKYLGSFGPKLGKIFARGTEAHEVLTRSESRREYDEYLVGKGNAQRLEAWLSERPLPRPSRVPTRTGPRSPSDPPSAATFRSEPPRAPSSPPSQQEPPPPSRTWGEPRPADHSSSGDHRKRALARKLGRPSNRPPPPSAGQSPSRTPDDPVLGDQDRTVVASVHARVKDLLASAEAALGANNPVGAANSLQTALSLSPDDPLLHDLIARTQARVDLELAQNYTTQAKYEEQHQKWPEAARSYERAASAKGTARLHERVAFCLLEAEGDLKKAAEHARQAVAMSPQTATLRITLARVYLSAGMRQSAIAEFERAQALAPADDTIATWLRRIRRNEI